MQEHTLRRHLTHMKPQRRLAQQRQQTGGSAQQLPGGCSWCRAVHWLPLTAPTQQPCSMTPLKTQYVFSAAREPGRSGCFLHVPSVNKPHPNQGDALGVSYATGMYVPEIQTAMWRTSMCTTEATCTHLMRSANWASCSQVARPDDGPVLLLSRPAPLTAAAPPAAAAAAPPAVAAVERLPVLWRLLAPCSEGQVISSPGNVPCSGVLFDWTSGLSGLYTPEQHVAASAEYQCNNTSVQATAFVAC
jgi:hypothetical protein